MRLHGFIVGLLLFSPVALAGGKLIDLQIDKEVVIFSTTQIKPLPNLACVANDAADKWTASLKTESGRAIYSLLVTALSKNLALEVSGAGDCADKDGIERSEGVKLGISEVPVSKGNSVGIYKSDGITRIGTVVGFVETSRKTKWYYVDGQLAMDTKSYVRESGPSTLYYSEANCSGEILLRSSGVQFLNGRYVKGDTNRIFDANRSERRPNGCFNTSSTLPHYPVIDGVHPVCGASPCLVKEDQ
ncbi:hypothetical protein [Bowmanella denitrificans]|uniref:hypothetical protein n=1 Tax=Bowmanella denitrificans TaxID=366582 RepID=UPI000C9AA96D|nr:hypothetical protein [Bowmanella denitrificans]